MPGPTKSHICAVILAGGKATRMGGGDKCLQKIGGKTLLEATLARLRPQVSQVVLNANGDADRFAEYGLPVAADSLPGHAGPLAGLLAGMTWAHHNAAQCTHLLSIAGDTPFFPKTLAADLAHALRERGADIAVASSDRRMHPVFGLWSLDLVKDLEKALVEENIRKIRFFMNRHTSVTYDYAVRPFDPFFNINTPDDIKQAEALARSV